MNASRRQLLEVTGAGLSVALAGCAGRDGGGGTTTTVLTSTTGSATTAATTTAETTTGTTSTDGVTSDETTTSEVTSDETTTDEVTVIAVNDQFDPIRLSVEPETTVVWENRESGTYASHSVKSARFHEKATKWTFEEELGKGESVSHTFADAGVYEYYCTVHGKATMCGVVLVGDASLSRALPCEDSGTTTAGDDGGYGDDY